MRIGRLALEDFRNYVREDLELAPGLNVVVGSNAQGKTNLLEAVYCLGGFGSPRGPDTALVREGSERALLHATVYRGTREVRVDMEIRPGRGTRVLLNSTPAAGPKALRDLSVSVFFGPDELSLIKGSPDGRRRFLDDLVVALRPARETGRREWERILKQRNALLRSVPRSGSAAQSARDTLEVWNESFCRVGAELASMRIEVLGLLLPFARKRYESIAGGGSLELSYKSEWLPDDALHAGVESPGSLSGPEVRSALEAAVEAVREREIERRVSLTGPQRDDVSVGLATRDGDGTLLDARVYASQGDQRTAALALKLAEHDLLSETLGEEPVLLLDDVFSELDPSRRRWLADTVRGTSQAVLSSAEPGVVESSHPSRIIEVTAGKIEVRDAR